MEALDLNTAERWNEGAGMGFFQLWIILVLFLEDWYLKPKLPGCLLHESVSPSVSMSVLQPCYLTRASCTAAVRQPGSASGVHLSDLPSNVLPPPGLQRPVAVTTLPGCSAWSAQATVKASNCCLGKSCIETWPFDGKYV